MLIWGPQLRVFPQGLLPAGHLTALGARIELLQILIIGGSALLMAALYLFVHHTRFKGQRHGSAQGIGLLQLDSELGVVGGQLHRGSLRRGTDCILGL